MIQSPSQGPGARPNRHDRTKTRQQVNYSHILGLLCILIGAITSMPADAQLVPGIPQITVPRPNSNPIADTAPVGVLERARPEYDALGFEFAEGVLYPSLTTGSFLKSNIFASQAAPVSDFVIDVRPAMTFRSRRDMLSYVVSVYGDYAKYLDHASLSNANAGASLGLIQEIGQDWEFESQTGFRYDHQSPSSFALPVPNAPISALPAYSIFSEQASLTRRVDRLTLAVGAGYQREVYQDAVVNGTLIRESALNANAFSVTSKVGYAVTPLTRIFAESEILRRNYDNGVLNSDTYTMVVGSDFELRRLTRGTIFAGVRTRQYDSGLIGGRTVPTFGFSLEWFPTELLTLNLVGRQDFADTPITTPNGGSAVVNVETIQLEADYEVLRQLIATGVVGFEADRYSATNRADNNLSFGLTLTYMLNRNLRLVGQYRVTDRHSNAAGFSYVLNEIGAAIRVQY